MSTFNSKLQDVKTNYAKVKLPDADNLSTEEKMRKVIQTLINMVEELQQQGEDHETRITDLEEAS